MITRNLSNVSWRTWISGIDNPARPTENTAIKNIRDAAKLREYERIMRVYGKKLASPARGKRHSVSSVLDIPKSARPAHNELYEQGHHT